MDKNLTKKTFFGGLIVLLGLIPAFSGLFRVSISHLLQLGVNIDQIYLLLIVPCIALIIATSRIIVGMNVSSIIVPSILVACCFILGPILTGIIFIGSALMALFIKYLLNELHMHFSAKMPVIVNLVFILVLLLAPILIENYAISSITLPSISLIMITLALLTEKFLSFKMTQNGLMTDFKNLFKTSLFSLATYLFLGGDLLGFKWTVVKDFILFFPEIISVCVILNLLIGRYTGLRISELIRFRDLIFKK